MISFFEASLDKLSVHRVGNKLQDEYFTLSDAPLTLEDEQLTDLLMQYFLEPFTKVNEIYHLWHPSADLALNEVFHFASEIFGGEKGFHDATQKIARFLYEVSSHPKIKSGELYVTLFRQVQIEGELLDALGIFKSETKETYLKVQPGDAGFELLYEQDAININKLDKGCLIFNTAKDQGYKVAVIDQTNRSSEAVYWKDDFLQLKVRNDAYNQTNTLMGVVKNFVTQKLDEEFDIGKTDKIDLLNRSMKYFKEKEQFDMDEFGSEVIGNEKGIASFRNFKENFEDEFETEIGENFAISGAAVKKQAKVYKSVLKLDRNFHIYIHGNRNMIEKGYDEEKRMNYYKVYFEEEE
ncbi:MAG: nucleoid-associated protein [Mucilaginibacter polytrichastri]|nr:nucleoid-associated protein [Mucilaginibacter polytrichastri]